MPHLRFSKCVATILAGCFCLFAATATAKSSGHKSSGDVSVQGHTTKNGTYVPSHMRSHPDGVFANNFSTKGNINPYTGKAGTKVTAPKGYGGSGLITQIGNDDVELDGAPGDATQHQATPQVRKPIVPALRMKWATDGLSAEDKAEHEELVAFLKDHHVNLFYWDTYSVDKLRDIKNQLLAGARPSSF